ncbi:MAG: hypothetical protein BMS9Abin25_1310 [Gammaproteobacteria bacterium]|nr:MAG: hypothetical protein BMS9Abin25_1310 [Gammaproteobacteria bacterium]
MACAITHLKGQALNIVINLQGYEETFTFIKNVNESPDMAGYVQINEKEWDSHSATDKLVDLTRKNTGRIAADGRQFAISMF